MNKKTNKLPKKIGFYQRKLQVSTISLKQERLSTWKQSVEK